MAEQMLINNENLVDLEELPCLDGALGDLEERPTLDVNRASGSSENGGGLCQQQPTEVMELEPDTRQQPGPSKENDDQVGGSAESASTVEASGFVFKCVFCDMVLSAKDRPKILECLHNACGTCLDQKVRELPAKEIHCTTCGCFLDSNNIIDNQFLNDHATSEDENKLEDVKCSSCSDEAPASSWCVDCSEFICDNCVQAHQRLKITKEHTIKPKEEGMQEQGASNTGETPLFCALHPHERLSLFCENCDKLTCRDCQLTDHRDHKYKFTHEIAADCRKVLSAMLTDISYKRILLSSAMKVIDDRQGLINEKKSALVQQITNLVVRLTNTISLRGKQLVSRLNEICDSKHKTLDEKKIALDHLSQVTDHCIMFTRNVLDYGSDNALLYSKKHLTNHLQRIKSRRADIPNPEIPVRIDLALDKVTDLIKVISNIGQIIVDGRVYPSTPSPQMPGPVRTPQGSPSPNTLQAQLQHPPQQQPAQQAPASHNNAMFMPPQRVMSGYAAIQPQYTPGPSNQVPIGPQVGMKQNPIQTLSQTVQNLNSNKIQACMQQGAMGALSRLSQQQQQQMNQHQQPQMSPHQQQQQQQQHMQQRMQPQQMQQLRPGNMPPQMHPRMSAPPMNQQVSSSTHPQTNLRNLLQPNGSNTVYIQTGPNQYQAVQPQYAQHYQNRVSYRPQQQQQTPPNQQQQAHGVSPPGSQPRCYIHPGQQRPSMPYSAVPARPYNSNPSGGKWHIPQHGNGLDQQNAQKTIPSTPTLNPNYKIMLKPQNLMSNVTSTNPKTPSPNTYINNDTTTEKTIDKFCEDSVNDLMATIAKLDSNGVQVLAENRPKTGSPHADSSTGDIVAKLKSESAEKDDPNEDWCAVCLDGGELVCCDKCPKVFHQFCHIPNLSVEESETWQCLLCMNFADIPDNADHLDNDLSLRQRKLAERIVLEMYCQYELSLPFREVVGTENQEYHEVIKHPMALDLIRQKLDWNSADRYKSLEDLVKDARLMFKNARLFNSEDSQVYSDANALEKFFDEQLEKWLPEYAYEMFEEEEEIPPPNKKYKRIIHE